MDNSNKVSNKEELNCGKVINIKDSHSFNESNLMTLPFISLKRGKEYELNRKWVRGNTEVALKIIGSSRFGCPTIYEMDVLMALFKIQLKNMDNKIVISSDNKVENMGNTINFTYRELAKEMGFKNFGSGVKDRLEKSVRCLVETTVYSEQAIRNQVKGDYVSNFEGEESFRIISKYKRYSSKIRKLDGEKLLGAEAIRESQSVTIDKFFFNNLVSNYFKIYDYEKYKCLKSSVAKKLLLILTQWSHGNEKSIKLDTLYEQLGIVDEVKKNKKYWDKRIREALDELLDIKFIGEYSFKVGDKIVIVFNSELKIKNKNLDKYKTHNEIIGRLREIGIQYDEMSEYCRLDTMGYIASLLRYVDYKDKKGLLEDIEKFTRKGLPYGSYDVSDFEIGV